jgi:hypothetical protein
LLFLNTLNIDDFCLKLVVYCRILDPGEWVECSAELENARKNKPHKAPPVLPVTVLTVLFILCRVIIFCATFLYTVWVRNVTMQLNRYRTRTIWNDKPA